MMVMQNLPGRFTIYHNLDTGSNLGASHVHAADMDGDGDMDILASFTILTLLFGLRMMVVPTLLLLL